MAFDYHSYAQLAGNDGQRQWQETQSIHAPSFVSTDSFEMRSYRGDSSRSRLLSQSSIPYARDDAPYLQSEPPLDFAKAGPGLWKNQMLVDRSLRGMALLTSIFALGMMIVVFVWLPKYTQNENSESTSVFAVKESCKTASIKNLIIHLVINIAGTMVLGMSNTYQQLVTALNVNDIPNMLRKTGDCKVGTNSPFSINRKSKGKLQAWLSWALLIATSLPIHLLANSFVGLSYELPITEIEFNPILLQPLNTTLTTPGSFECWSIFRTGADWWESSSKPSSILKPGQTIEEYIAYESSMATRYRVVISYDEELCSSLRESATSLRQLEAEYNNGNMSCINRIHVSCAWENIGTRAQKISCQISIRMQAAITLAGALLVKAVYMVAWNFRMRGKVKTKCLTFGDVIAASALNRELQVPNECLVNAGDAHRKAVEHTCHDHCKSKEPSNTGDELGHCQKCRKWNRVNMKAGLEHPIVATKYKKSLISNLGSNAVTQMILLSACSMAMLGVSIFVAVVSGMEQQAYIRNCRIDPETGDGFSNQTYYDECMRRAPENWRDVSGGWGGQNESVPLAALPANRITSESASFLIANGAQLIYSLLYLLVIYNITLISMERDWGSLETVRSRIRCTLFSGQGFHQSYLLQLPKRIIFPIMGFSALMHWLLGQAISTKEWVWFIKGSEAVGVPSLHVSQYQVVYAAYPLWLSTVLMIAMTSVCWWAFTYSREGFMPQMYGCIRVCCAATTSLKSFPNAGIQWGDLGAGKRFRCAGFSEHPVAPAVPGELYCSGSAEAEDLAYSTQSSLRQRFSNETMKSKASSQYRKRVRSGSQSTDYHVIGQGTEEVSG